MGAMEASSRGASEAGGRIIGVTSKTFSHRTPNPYLTEERMTNDLLDRIATLMRLADAYIVMDGSIGTLAELFVAWNMLATGWDKPLIVVGDYLRCAMEVLQDYTEIREKHLDVIEFVPDEAAAVNFLHQHYKMIK